MKSPHLPAELAILILERLPPASFFRLQCACKLWRRIISAPGFLERTILLPRNRRETSLLIVEARREEHVGIFIDPSYSVLRSRTCPRPTEFGPRPRQPDTYFWSTSVVMVGSYRGVVCLAELDSGRCVFWNPTTRKSMALPDHDHACFYYLGLGYYEGDFKVVKISKPYDEDDEPITVRAHIYELSLDSWREISSTGIDSNKIISPHHTDRALACWRDGKMCSWMVCWKIDYENRTRECSIVSFDMANEAFTSFSSVPMPFCSDGVGLLALNDLLALWCCHSSHRHLGKEKVMDIWVSLQHGVVESWAKLWTIRVGPEPHWPLELWNGGLVMTKGSQAPLLWCDLSNSPLIIQALPVFALPSCSSRGSSKVVAFEKAYTSLDSDRTALILKASGCETKAAKLNASNARKRLPEAEKFKGRKKKKEHYNGNL